MRASNIPGEISTSCNSAEQSWSRGERELLTVCCTMKHLNVTAFYFQSIPQRAWRWRLCPAPSLTPSLAFLNKSREMKKVEELMSKGHIQNKQRMLKKVCARQVPSPSLSVSTERGEAGKILFWFLSGLINWKNPWTKSCSWLTDMDGCIHPPYHTPSVSQWTGFSTITAHNQCLDCKQVTRDLGWLLRKSTLLIIAHFRFFIRLLSNDWYNTWVQEVLL